jgi:hypothetical protein
LLYFRQIFNFTVLKKYSLNRPYHLKYLLILFQFLSLVLDEVGTKEEQNSNEPTLKTRSLPAWVRSKPRPLSTEDDLNDLYAKVRLIHMCKIIL